MRTTRALFIAPSGGRSGKIQPKSKCLPRRSAQQFKGRRPKSRTLFRILVELPPEVFNEIASFLLPTDILNLARSSKFFRGIFMSRTSRQIWKETMQNVSFLPPCPPELVEPQYISLIYSQTCSSCGTTVSSRMDPFLLVRLCNACCDEQVETKDGDDENYSYLPRGTVIKECVYGMFHTLTTEIEKIRAAAESDPGFFSDWKKARLEQIKERENFGYELEGFLDKLESERMAEIKRLQDERWEQIKARLANLEWEPRDIDRCCSFEWFELVNQVEPITDPIWTDLYPKLIPILRESKEDNLRADRERRRRARVEKIEELAARVKSGIPPLVHVTIESSPALACTSGPSSFASTAASFGLPINNHPDVKVDMPFPSVEEYQEWPMVKSILDEDLLPEDAEKRLMEIEIEFHQAAIQWRHKIDKVLVDIWHYREDIGDEEDGGATAVRSEGRVSLEGAEPTGSCTLGLSERTATNEDQIKHSLVHAFNTPLPHFVVTYAKLDGSTTTDSSDLSPEQRLLFQADTFFQKGEDSYTYLDIISSLASGDMTADKQIDWRYYIGELKRDVKASAVAGQLLSWLARPNASWAEIKSFGNKLICEDFGDKLISDWSGLVQHYAQEEDQWEKVRDKISMKSRLLGVDCRTRDLKPEYTNKPDFTTTRTPRSRNSARANRMRLASCLVCEDDYFQGGNFYTFCPGAHSPIELHLREIHSVIQAEIGVHFELLMGSLINPNVDNENHSCI